MRTSLSISNFLNIIDITAENTHDDLVIFSNGCGIFSRWILGLIVNLSTNMIIVSRYWMFFVHLIIKMLRLLGFSMYNAALNCI